METWKDVLIEPMKEKLVTSVLQEISNHRHGLPANDVNSQVVIHSLVTVEGYKKKSPLKVKLSTEMLAFYICSVFVLGLN